MTRAELEAIIWRRWPARGAHAAEAVDSILRAADQYRITSGAPAPHPDPVVQGRRDALLAELGPGGR